LFLILVKMNVLLSLRNVYSISVIGRREFERYPPRRPRKGCMSTETSTVIAQVSRATAYRELTDRVALGVLGRKNREKSAPTQREIVIACY